jgi:hypothetical protein
MTFTAQPMRDGRVSVRPTPKTPIPGRPAVTSPSEIPTRDGSCDRPDGCLICGKPRPSMRALYCDDACKQRAFRLRHGAGTRVDLATLRRDLQRRKVRVAHTIYECGTCGEQYVGERRCPECHTFNRALGLGGNCPDCDTPILLADLLGEEGLSIA